MTEHNDSILNGMPLWFINKLRNCNRLDRLEYGYYSLPVMKEPEQKKQPIKIKYKKP